MRRVGALTRRLTGDIDHAVAARLERLNERAAAYTTAEPITRAYESAAAALHEESQVETRSGKRSARESPPPTAIATAR